MMPEEPHSTRVVLVGCTGLLGDIIRTSVLEAADLEVVAELGPEELGPGTGFVGADVVMWNQADETHLERLLTASAAGRIPKVLATVSDGRDAALWELVPRRTPLGSLSPASLVASIRSAAGTARRDSADPT